MRATSVSAIVLIPALLLSVACSRTTKNESKKVDSSATPERLNVWSSGPSTVPATCNDDCVKVRTLPFGHGVGAEKVTLYVDPRIDDPISRWGDCLGDVMGCWLRKGSPAECVAGSKCPGLCKDAYARRVGKDATVERQLDEFEAIFVRDDGGCVPEVRGESNP